MSEKTDYQLLRKHMLQGHDRLDRIENMAGAGTPDINYCIDGVEGWIELKSPIEPKRSTTRCFTGHAHKLNQAQMNWFLKQRNAGGLGWILIMTDKRWMLINGSYADDINERTVWALKRISSWSAKKPVNKVMFRSLRQILKYKE